MSCKKMLFSIVVFLMTNASFLPSCSFAALINQNNLINIRVHDEPLEEVFKEIEKQTHYKIKVKGAVTHLVTIVLQEYPLDKGISRILTGLNYSIVGDDLKKMISIKIISGSGQDANDSQNIAMRSGNDIQQVAHMSSYHDYSEMSGVAAAFAAYKSGNEDTSLAPDSSSPQAAEMSGVAAAFAAYKSGNVDTSPVSDSTTPQAAEMSGVATALAAYKSGNVDTSPVPDSSSPQAPEMSSVAAALVAYKSGNVDTSPVPDSSTPQAAEMSDATAALAAYYGKSR